MKIPFKKQIQQLNKIDTFSPYFFLPFILVLYFFTSLFDFYRFEYFNVQNSIWPSVILALVSYYIGVYLVDKKKWTIPQFGLGILQGKSIYFIWILAIVGLGAYGTMLFTGQIGIADESARRNLDPKLNFLSQLLWFSLLLLLSLKIIKEPKITMKKGLIYGFMYGAGMVLFLLMGYRTPIIIMLFSALIIFHYVIKRIKLTWFLSTLVVIGGGHVGAAVAHLADWLGFRIVVSDDRPEFASSDAVPEADEIHSGPMADLPSQLDINENTYLVLTTRGVDVDVPGLPALLETPAAYIGVIGSRRRWETTSKALLDHGVSQEALARVRSPIGLELNAETPEEIAVSILSEIIMLRQGGTGDSMAHHSARLED